MTKIDFNDLFYVCAMIEYVARETCNKRGIIVSALGETGLRKQIEDAPVNHCLTTEQVAGEWIQQYDIKKGTFDTVSACQYKVPDYYDIGKLYAYLTEDLAGDQDEIPVLKELFGSFLSDEISDFNTDLYYQNCSYLTACYRAGKILS